MLHVLMISLASYDKSRSLVGLKLATVLFSTPASEARAVEGSSIEYSKTFFDFSV